MTMLKDPSLKYKKFDPKLNLKTRQWPLRTLDKPPRWLSTDLRDGNQSLPDPMTVEEKQVYFKKLVEIGFKEIEVAFPSASQIDFDFTRWCVQNAPSDVAIQVLAPCRPQFIKRTIDALKGAKKAIVHIYMATSECFRDIVFNLSKEETKKQATECTRYVRTLTKDDPNMQETEWMFEFSPETFSDTDPDYAIEVCESVKAAWNPSIGNPIIFNLPATVEMSTPNVYADQIENFCNKISERKKVCISLHPHNDRGCAVAAAELAQLAGADRVEGCLFGNGERTGNVDLVTLALNLYTQGINPHLDFSDMKSVIDVVEKCNKIPIHPRAPYGGQLVVCAFSGSHQDAIKKGFKKHEQKKRKLAFEAENSGKKPRIADWKMPYLPLDPRDIGRTYEAIIRVNSQSGKGGASWIILRNLELDLPRGLQIEFSKVVQRETEAKTRELKTSEIVGLFETKYIIYPENTVIKLEKVNAFRLVDYHSDTKKGGKREIHSIIKNNNKEIKLNGVGNGPISAFANSLAAYFNRDFDVVNYHEHSLGKDSDSQAASYINCRIGSNPPLWGVGIHEDVNVAGFNALISCLNQSVRANFIHLN